MDRSESRTALGVNPAAGRVLVIAAALLIAALALGVGQLHSVSVTNATPGVVDTVAIDMDSSGNAANGPLGTREECIAVAVDQTVTIDRSVATRLEVCEQQPVFRPEHVVWVRLAVQQLLGGAPVDDRPPQALHSHQHAHHEAH